MPIRAFLDGHKFDPETTRVMGVAFEIVRAALQFEGRRNAATHEALAKSIIAIAQQGERDPERICDRVLADLRQPPTPELPV